MAIPQAFSPYLTVAYLQQILNTQVSALTFQQLKDLVDYSRRQTDHKLTDTLVSAFTNSTGPTVLTGALTPSAESPTTQYDTGDHMVIVVTFSDYVYVTGTPEIHLVIGSNTRQATYSSGSGTTALSFSYTVVSGDMVTASHVSVATSALVLNSGTIDDVTGNAATLTLPTVSGISTASCNE